LPAKNDNAVGLVYRGAWFAGKPRSNGICIRWGAIFFRKTRAYQPRPEFTQKFTDSDVVIDST
jgi:hypothetical protein